MKSKFFEGMEKTKDYATTVLFAAGVPVSLALDYSFGASCKGPFLPRWLGIPVVIIGGCVSVVSLLFCAIGAAVVYIGGTVYSGCSAVGSAIAHDSADQNVQSAPIAEATLKADSLDTKLTTTSPVLYSGQAKEIGRTDPKAIVFGGDCAQVKRLAL